MGIMAHTPNEKFKFVPIAVASKLVGITTSRLRQLLRKGELAGFKAGPRMWLIPERELAKFANKPQMTGRPRVGRKLQLRNPT
jgi:excisionase family DNA binding protein